MWIEIAWIKLPLRLECVIEMKDPIRKEQKQYPGMTIQHLSMVLHIHANGYGDVALD